MIHGIDWRSHISLLYVFGYYFVLNNRTIMTLYSPPPSPPPLIKRECLDRRHWMHNGAYSCEITNKIFPWTSNTNNKVGRVWRYQTNLNVAITPWPPNQQLPVTSWTVTSHFNFTFWPLHTSCHTPAQFKSIHSIP